MASNGVYTPAGEWGLWLEVWHDDLLDRGLREATRDHDLQQGRWFAEFATAEGLTAETVTAADVRACLATDEANLDRYSNSFAKAVMLAAIS